ncbi:four-carbon acid sugar kinase family protein [Acidovorax sp. LjRoot129]|uniref:four-carbon acid sugar kinase family protein n=1 Tax=Acidovorax sp. LjRoot129 TaxID=3342260 RepID=UPI003ECD08FF
MTTSAPLYGWYGDDFTGATDTLAVLAQAGLRSMLFMGVPSAEALAAAGPLDAVGIAGAARAMEPDAMRIEMSAVGMFFQQVAPPVLHYKVCSTFDSAPHVGNIACGIQTLHPFVNNRWVPIVGGQPSLGRYCAFSNLFAAAGTGGAVHRIDRHPTMRQHPVTPMGEADLRLHLARQGLEGITALHYPLYDTNADASTNALDAALQDLLDNDDAPRTMAPTLLDLTTPEQLATVGRLLWQQAQKARLLAVGSSAVAQALVAHWAKPTPPAAPPLTLADGPVFAWAGSLSPLTAAQVQAATAYQRIPVDAQRLGNDPAYAQTLLAAICTGLQQGQHVLAYTGPTDGTAANITSAEQVAQASANLVDRVVQAQAEHGTPLRRIGIAGGDTSSHVVQALQLWGLSYQTTLCPGVTLSRARSQDPARDGLELMLKGGQMGGTDLFAKLLGEG